MMFARLARKANSLAVLKSRYPRTFATGTVFANRLQCWNTLVNGSDSPSVHVALGFEIQRVESRFQPVITSSMPWLFVIL